MEDGKVIFLFKWVIFRFQSLIFQGIVVVMKRRLTQPIPQKWPRQQIWWKEFHIVKLQVVYFDNSTRLTKDRYDMAGNYPQFLKHLTNYFRVGSSVEVD